EDRPCGEGLERKDAFDARCPTQIRYFFQVSEKYRFVEQIIGSLKRQFLRSNLLGPRLRGRARLLLWRNAIKKSAPDETRKTPHLAIAPLRHKTLQGKFSRAMTVGRFSAITFRMRKIVLVGIGTGNPDHLTVAGIDALKSADI